MRHRRRAREKEKGSEASERREEAHDVARRAAARGTARGRGGGSGRQLGQVTHAPSGRSVQSRLCVAVVPDAKWTALLDKHRRHGVGVRCAFLCDDTGTAPRPTGSSAGVGRRASSTSHGDEQYGDGIRCSLAGAFATPLGQLYMPDCLESSCHVI